MQKQHERHILDFSYALAIYEGDPKTLSDHSFTQSFHRAVRNNDETIEEQGEAPA